MKKFTLTGGISGAVIGIIISIYFANQNGCIGSYLDHIDQNGVPVMGTVCPKVNVLANLQNSILPELGTIITLLLIGMFIGWIIGKIIIRQHGTVMN
ncbi:MAG: hypothetical protein RL536_226 [Candidatus Parcubacteria bacterium]|jgi:uncharacterized membrane protein YraQ (UPF0718 family)